MYETIIFFLGASLVLYGLLGGADFGAGILELSSPKALVTEIETAIYKAMGPVWEANHMWLILAVVILFNGFPQAYSDISTLLHIPLTLLLVCIIIRGCAFTFRHYDALEDGSSKIYSLAFRLSSLCSALLMGMMVASLIKGEFKNVSSGSYWEIYWQPWLSPFCVCVGVFVCILFAYQSSAFLIGEQISEDLRLFFKKRSKQLLLAAVAWGPIVFASSYFEGASLELKFFQSYSSLTSLVLATLVLPLVIWSMNHNHKWITRISLGLQVSCILGGVFFFQYPAFIIYEDGSVLSLTEAAAPEATLKALLGALIVGSAVIFPSLFYLFRIFKKDDV